MEVGGRKVKERGRRKVRRVGGVEWRCGREEGEERRGGGRGRRGGERGREGEGGGWKTLTGKSKCLGSDL